MVAILTSGTLTDPDMLRAQPEAAYVLSLCERALPPVAAGAPAETLLSACYCDCASNTLVLGQWCALACPLPARLPATVALRHRVASTQFVWGNKVTLPGSRFRAEFIFF